MSFVTFTTTEPLSDTQNTKTLQYVKTDDSVYLLGMLEHGTKVVVDQQLVDDLQALVHEQTYDRDDKLSLTPGDVFILNDTALLVLKVPARWKGMEEQVEYQVFHRYESNDGFDWLPAMSRGLCRADFVYVVHTGYKKLTLEEWEETTEERVIIKESIRAKCVVGR